MWTLRMQPGVHMVYCDAEPCEFHRPRKEGFKSTSFDQFLFGLISDDLTHHYLLNFSKYPLMPNHPLNSRVKYAFHSQSFTFSLSMSLSSYFFNLNNAWWHLIPFFFVFKSLARENSWPRCSKSVSNVLLSLLLLCSSSHSCVNAFIFCGFCLADLK